VPRAEPPDLFTAAPLPIAPLDRQQKLNCLRLIRSENVGPVAFRTLINRYGSAGQALDALPDLARRGGGSARSFSIYPLADAEAELEAAERIDATPVFTIEPGYPRALAALEAPPPLVYVKGDLNLLSRPSVAIVGSRDCTAGGIKIAAMLARQLGEAGYVIASGLARGIDGAAHQAALATGTAAVMAGGLDIIYPPEHAALMARIAEAGALISEQPPGFRPRAADFPRRNRIISGISLGVVIVEAAARSGTLVTARHANEQGREVFAVPGHPLDPRAEGTNRLIKSGATLVTTAEDILDVLAPIAGFSETTARMFDDRPPAADDTASPASAVTGERDVVDDDRGRVWAALGAAPIDLDSLVRATGLPNRLVQIVLLDLDLAGRLIRPGPGLVARAPDDQL
jgi:DNA processing protein